MAALLMVISTPAVCVYEGKARPSLVQAYDYIHRLFLQSALMWTRAVGSRVEGGSRTVRLTTHKIQIWLAASLNALTHVMAGEKGFAG